MKGYVWRVLDKLACANRTQAGLLAFAGGLGEPGGERRDPPPAGVEQLGWTGN